MTDTLPPLPSPWDYCYVWSNTYSGEHRSFSANHYNGVACDTQVILFTADQMREYGKACAALPAAQPEHAIQALNDSLLLDPDMPVRGVHLEAAQPTVNPPEFQEVSWGVDSVMRPCLGMAVSEYAFRQWAKDVGIVLAAPVAQTPAGVKGPEHG
jgi:hypothetical protein